MHEESHNPEEPLEKLTFPDVVKAVFTDYVGFAARYFPAGRPPLMYIAVWLIGMDAMAGGIELSRIYGEQYVVENWFYAWIRIIFAGLAMGIVRYWLVGSLFHLVVLAAGGHGPPRISRYIVLYALFPVSVCDLSIKILQMLMYGNAYFIGQTNAAIESLFGTVMLGAYVYTMLLCYRGMHYLQQTDKKRSIAVLAAVSIGTVLLAMVGMG